MEFRNHQVLEKVGTTIREHDLLRPGDHLVIGVSGGPDSLCLLDVLHSLRDEWRLTITAVHVNHGFRRETAAADQRFVEDFCAERGIDCRSFSFDCPAIAKKEGWTLEEAGRNMRYRAFAEVCDQAKERKEQVKIVVAHHRDDQVETLLQRLIRGTGVDGLAGMEYGRLDACGHPVIRPLLDVGRREIEEYCRQRGLRPRKDETNEQTHFMRNKIRRKLLPDLREEYGAGVEEALWRLSRSAAEDRQYWKQEAKKALANIREDGTAQGTHLNREELCQMPSALRHRVMRQAFFDLGLIQDLERIHIEGMDRLMAGKQASGRIDLPHGYRFQVSYDRCICQRPGFAKPQEESGSLVVRLRKPEKEHPQGPSSKVAQFDADPLQEQIEQEGLKLRSRQPGDWIRLPGGRKKIQDLFVDKKIPRERRDGFALVAMGSEILWIPEFPDGGLVSAAHPVTEETVRILELTINV